MRADRLVATLLFLQSRGRVTAAEVAAELEVSVKTARRDLEALSIAGIPVYSQPGRGGGWALVGGARTDLSGLTAAEARTLFLVAGPSSAVTPEAKAALRKLVHALPETFRAEAEKAASAIVLDPAALGRQGAVDAAASRSAAAGRDRRRAGPARLHRRAGRGDRARRAPVRASCPKARRGTSSPTPTPAGARSACGACSRSSCPTNQRCARPTSICNARGTRSSTTLDERRGLRHVDGVRRSRSGALVADAVRHARDVRRDRRRRSRRRRHRLPARPTKTRRASSPRSPTSLEVLDPRSTRAHWPSSAACSSAATRAERPKWNIREEPRPAGRGDRDQVA